MLNTIDYYLKMVGFGFYFESSTSTGNSPRL